MIGTIHILNMLGFLLFIVAIILLIILEFISFFFYWFSVGNVNGYWLSVARDIDKFGNKHFRYLFNNTLIKKNGHQFGNIKETISQVLGYNILTNTLTIGGKIVVFILTKKHCLNAINDLE